MNYHGEFVDHLSHLNWNLLKIQSVKYGQMLKKLGSRRSFSVLTCCNHLFFKPDKNTGLLHMVGPDKTSSANVLMCHKRFCSICAKRASIKNRIQLYHIIKKSLSEYSGSKILFITWTIKNVSGNRIRWAINILNRAFNYVINYAKPSRSIVGAIKDVECICHDRRCNKGRVDSNVHIHTLIQVKSTYFKGPHFYIKQSEWMSFWKRAVERACGYRINYDPIVDVRVIKPNSRRHTGSLLSSCYEVCKYTTKPSTFLSKSHSNSWNLRCLKDLEIGFSGVRHITLYGNFRSLKAKLFPSSDNKGSDSKEDLSRLTDKKYHLGGRRILVEWNRRRDKYFYA